MPNTSASTILGNETSKIQNALKRAGIPIDLTSNAGLNTVMVVDSMALPPEYPYDDVDMPTGESERAISRIENNIKDGSNKSVLVFEPGCRDELVHHGQRQGSQNVESGITEQFRRESKVGEVESYQVGEVGIIGDAGTEQQHQER